MPQITDPEGLIQRVFPLRIEVDDRPRRQNLDPVVAKEACHTRKKTKFDGPKIWGTSGTNLVQKEKPQFTDNIQQFGALVALCRTADSFATIAVSENASTILALPSDDLFGSGCFSRFIHQDSREDFRSRLDTIADEVLKVSDCTTPIDPEICSVWISTASGAATEFWCTMHATIRDPNVLICELEEFIPFHSKPNDAIKVRTPSRRLNYSPTSDEYLRATTSKSIPLRFSRNSTIPTLHYQTVDSISLMNQVQRQYSSALSIPELYDAIVGTVSELTKFDRVMVYRFDECKCGAVVGELLNLEASKDVFLGLHFPSSDVPIPIRESYKLDRVQVLREKSESAASVIDRDGNKARLDLSRCYLRAFSPEQVGYFSRMEVRSAMSISLVVEDNLWGLIMCHSYDPEVTVVSPPLKELCRTIGQCASTQVERLLSKEKMELRSSLMAGLSLKSPAAFLTADTTNLLQVFSAEFGILTLNGEARAIGKLEAYQEALALVQYFRSRKPTKVISSQKIATDFPDLNYEPGFVVLAGVLIIPLSDSGADFLTLFRKGQLFEIFWAGNEQEQFQYIGGEVPEPTAGLLRWVEHVTDTSREWTDDQMDIATVIGLLYGTFIKTWRQKEAMEETSRVRRLLISNAAHEVRTPLNSIINYLEMTLDGPIDDLTREQLGRSLTASKSLIYSINDLLDLTRVTGIDPTTMGEIFDFRKELDGVINVFRQEAIRKDLALSAEIHIDTLPTLVKGDPMRLRQAVSNILTNALEYTVEGKISITADVPEIKDDRTAIEITVQDEGCGMSEAHLDSLFQHLEHIIWSEPETASIESEGMVGLGLAVVARFVRNCEGQLKIRSKAGVGTTVVLQMALLSMTESDSKRQSLETRSSDQAMADLLQNIEERASMLSDRTTQSDYTPTTELASVGSMPMSSPASSTDLDSRSSVISSAQVSPSLEKSSGRGFPFPSTKDERLRFRILVAEDNPLNSKILNLRLSKLGHTVTLTPDGQACADRFIAGFDEFDVILMDLQMPLLDGHRSTKLIRSFEASQPRLKLSSHAACLGRIPIFAVSASLLEDLREEYIADGFDGWIMKPIDFKRLDLLIEGICDKDTRDKCMYKKGEFESGGWFKDT